MEGSDDIIFRQLYREAYSLCFKKSLQKTVSETESKLFYNEILEQTGLTVGWRSLKNYSFYVLGENSDRQENPSVATLDTLARYVLKAPFTTELVRKQNEAHHPYWYLYRARSLENTIPAITQKKQPNAKWIVAIAFILLLTGTAITLWLNWHGPDIFTENFENEDMTRSGWKLQNINPDYWNKRKINPHALTLYTLPGDNWPDSAASPAIQNLLIRRLPQDCFQLELQMKNFIPSGEWQQAGVLLLADSSLNSASIRMSLAFNDFFGGNDLPKEIIVQAISSLGNGAKPEEFIHYKVLAPDSAAKKPILFGNLKHTALRIEKKGKAYRFLYAGGFTEEEAFKELAAKNHDIVPRYVAIFALKGRVNHTQIVPVSIKKFMLQSIPCQ